MRLASSFNTLALASYMRARYENSIRTRCYGFPERYPGHPHSSAAHTNGVELTDVIQTEIWRLCHLCSGINVSNGSNLLISDSHTL